MKTTSLAHPNIAFIKYWGNRDQALRLPVNGSLSMNLAALETRTNVSLDKKLSADHLFINEIEQSGTALHRVQTFMTLIRQMSGQKVFADIHSSNNFPSSAGIASSAAAFAALAVAGASAYSLNLSEKDLSRLARRGSGSACRSIPTGYVEWKCGTSDADSYAQSIASPQQWDLWDCIAVVESGPKTIGSTEGHLLAGTSPLQSTRVSDADRRLSICRDALLTKDFDKLADIIELDSNIMHAVMMTSEPVLMYWSPASLLLMKEISELRRRGIAAAYTLDAGPNVHAICTAKSHGAVKQYLADLPGVQNVIVSPVGGAARLLS